MNTEAMNVLKQIRETTNLLQEELENVYYKDRPEARVLLEKVLNNLYDQEDLIINNTIQNIVDKLENVNQQLQSLIAEMTLETLQIAKLNDAINKAYSMVAALLKITTVAVSAGLL